MNINFLYRGVHEAIAAVSADEAGSYAFIVTSSQVAPAYATVSSKKVFYQRNLTPGTATNMYFSTTDQTPDTVADISSVNPPNADGSGTIAGQEQFSDPSQYLKANTQYYVHVYKANSYLSSQAFSTVAFPDTSGFTTQTNLLEAFAKDGDTDDVSFDNVDNRYTVEVKIDEVIFIPYREAQITGGSNLFTKQVNNKGACFGGSIDRSCVTSIQEAGFYFVNKIRSTNTHDMLLYFPINASTLDLAGSTHSFYIRVGGFTYELFDIRIIA